MFQSLFFWNHYLDFPYDEKINIEKLFQSLFFWNHYLDEQTGLWPWLSWRVSILVFLEPLLRQFGPGYSLCPCLVSILVFLEPLLRPAFSSVFHLFFIMFQSLFFWNHYLDSKLFPGFLTFPEFQSLFFWNHYLDHFAALIEPHFPEFQSLFFWNHYLDKS